MRKIYGNVIKGFGVASSDPTHTRGGLGTIAFQAPIFKTVGFDLDHHFPKGWFAGTINISVAPLKTTIHRPDIIIQNLDWMRVGLQENFFFINLLIEHKDAIYRGLLYYIDPGTKKGCGQSDGIIEVVAEHVPGIGYGDSVAIIFDSAKMHFSA
jgi:hypothetical protein